MLVNISTKESIENEMITGSLYKWPPLPCVSECECVCVFVLAIVLLKLTPPKTGLLHKA